MNLNGKWKLTGTDIDNSPLELLGTVPGCVHTDLLAAGVINDIYWRDNSKYCQWISDRNFTYEKEFTVENIEENAWIEFDGLDTYCDVWLNEQKIGSADNMFILHSFCVDGALKEGENILKVCFRSPIKEVEGKPELNAAFSKERVHSRRMQCTYGWDWVERLVTMGIYRDVRLVYRKPNEISDVYVFTKSINPYSAQIKIEMNFNDVIPEKEDVKIKIYSPENQLIFEKKRKILINNIEEYIDIPDAKLWYPNGYGEQPLYKLIAETENSKKEVIFGIRELVILQLEDAEDSEERKLCRELQKKRYLEKIDLNEKTSCFIVLVNGVKIMCKGANWVPCEPFPSAETPEKMRMVLKMATKAGMNMLRVWGGGIFEQDFFYEECNRLGILVTQDFMMACGTYPEKEEWFIEELKKETKAAALRLRNHPCLAWWTGDNENGANGTENKTEYRGYISATYGIAPILKQYDRERHFFGTSPWGGDTYASSTKGTTHNTIYLGDIFDYIENSDFSDFYEYFSGFISRFTVELGALGLPFVSSLKNFMSDEDIFGDDQYISEYHMKNNPELAISLFEYTNIMTKKIFGEYENGEDRVLKQQMLQCEWTRLTFEAHRRNKWFSAGLIYWMLNDCWPSANGWAIVDYYNNPKPAYYVFKRCAQPVIASIDTKNDRLKVYVCNDDLENCEGKGRLYLYDIAQGTEALEREFSFSIGENSSDVFFDCDFNEYKSFMNENTVLICDIESNLNNDRAFYINGRYKDMKFVYNDIVVSEETNGEIMVTANNFCPYVLLDNPNMLSDNCFALKKGESRTLLVEKN